MDADRPYRPGDWAKLVQPIVSKCEVGTMFGERVVFTKDGADALGKLLKEMAQKLDVACTTGIGS